MVASKKCRILIRLPFSRLQKKEENLVFNECGIMILNIIIQNLLELTLYTFKNHTDSSYV